jgi:hypothetical protein
MLVKVKLIELLYDYVVFYDYEAFIDYVTFVEFVEGGKAP